MTITTPRLSIVIPHLNEPHDLERCLKQLHRQRSDGVSYEIIVVDNGSRVPPSDLCAAFPDTRLERESTPGPGPARSRGARVAQGEIVAFIDADCLADDGWMDAIMSHMDSHPETHVIAGNVRVLREDEARPTRFEVYESIFSYLIPRYVERDRYAATGNMAVRRAVFSAVGPFLGIGVAEDREWGQRATRLGYRIDYVPRVSVHTPACKSFRELLIRWDRAIAHDYADMASGPGGKLKWYLRSLLVTVSPIFEIPKILRSPEARTFRDKWLAFDCLARVRLHRGRRMISQATQGLARLSLEKWNRE